MSLVNGSDWGWQELLGEDLAVERAPGGLFAPAFSHFASRFRDKRGRCTSLNSYFGDMLL
jgi:hypothetical protein